MTVYAKGSRMIAPVDAALDPSRARSVGGGFLRSSAGRGRATALPTIRAGAGDFGPLLHWHADDLTTDGSTIVWPCRTSAAAAMRSSVAHPTIGTTFNGESKKALVLSNDSAQRMISSDLSALFGAVGVPVNYEAVVVFELVGTPSGEPAIQAGIFGTDTGTNASGTFMLGVDTDRRGFAFRGVPGDLETTTTTPIQLNALRVLSFAVSADPATTYVNGIPSDVCAAGFANPVWTGTTFRVGANSSVGAAGVRIREIAFYSRDLTRAERIAIWRGYANTRDSIHVNPTLSDVLDMSAGSWLVQDTMSTSIVAGVVETSGDWTKAAGSPVQTRAWTDSTYDEGRIFRLPTTAEMTCGAPISVASGQAWTCIVGAMNDQTVAAETYTEINASGDSIGATATTRLGSGTYNGTTINGADDLLGLALAVSLTHDGIGTLDLLVHSWLTRTDAIGTSTATAAVAPRAATWSAAPVIGGARAGAGKHLGLVFARKALTAEEKRTIVRFWQQERTDIL